MDYLLLVTLALGLINCLLNHAEAIEDQSAFYFSTLPPVHVITVESQTLRLKCTPRNMSNDIIWSKILPNGGEQQLQQSPGRFDFEFFGQILVVKTVEWEDSGRYKCAVTDNKTVLDFAEIDVQVHTVPHWRHEPKDLLLQPGDSGEIVCDAAGNPPPRVTWEINGHQVDFNEDGLLTSSNGLEIAGNKLYLNGTSLSIINAEPQDAAVIRCYASNDYGKLIADVYLDVLEMLPRFLHIPQSVSQVVAGYDITIKCTPIGSPKPDVTWSLNSEPITINETSEQPRFKVDNDGSLTIYRVPQSDDEGMYTCKANNTLGEITASGKLQVKARTRVHCNTARQIEKKGKHVFLRCSIDADPTLDVKVTWEKDGKPVKPGCSDEDRIFQPPDIGMHNSVLVIRYIERDDSATYTSVARTPLDKAAAQTVLVVQDVPDCPGPIEVAYRTNSSVFVSWKPGNEYNSATELFIIYMNSTWEGGLWNILKMLPPGSKRTRVDLEPWTSYNFRVKQMNGVGYSDLSDPSPTYKTAASRPYSSPEDVRAESTNSSYINVFWKAMSPRQFNGPGFRYVLSWRRPDSDEAWDSKLVENPATDKTTIFTNGEYGRYEIRVRAANSVGMAPTPWSINVNSVSESINASIHSDSSEQTEVSEPLTAPKKFQVLTISSTEITIEWEPIEGLKTGGALQEYVIRYWKQGSPELDQVTAASSTSTMTLTSLTPATNYVIHMYGFNKAGDGTPTNNLVVQTKEDVPGPVIGFVAAVEGNNLQIQWNEPEETNGVLLGYQIIITQYEGLDIVEKLVHISNPNETEYTITDLLPETTYRVEVQASTSAGFGTVTFWEVRTPVF